MDSHIQQKNIGIRNNSKYKRRKRGSQNKIGVAGYTPSRTTQQYSHSRGQHKRNYNTHQQYSAVNNSSDRTTQSLPSNKNDKSRSNDNQPQETRSVKSIQMKGPKNKNKDDKGPLPTGEHVKYQLMTLYTLHPPLWPAFPIYLLEK